jgi:hypothetical protein
MHERHSGSELRKWKDMVRTRESCIASPDTPSVPLITFESTSMAPRKRKRQEDVEGQCRRSKPGRVKHRDEPAPLKRRFREQICYDEPSSAQSRSLSAQVDLGASTLFKPGNPHRPHKIRPASSGTMVTAAAQIRPTGTQPALHISTCSDGAAIYDPPDTQVRASSSMQTGVVS